MSFGFEIGTNPVPYIIMATCFAFITFFIKGFPEYLSRMNIKSIDKFGPIRKIYIWLFFLISIFLIMFLDSLVIVTCSYEEDCLLNLIMIYLMLIAFSLFPYYLILEFLMGQKERRNL